MTVHDVRLKVEGSAGLQGSLCKEGKALGVIGIIAVSCGVKRPSGEITWMLDEIDRNAGGESRTPDYPIFRAGAHRHREVRMHFFQGAHSTVDGRIAGHDHTHLVPQTG